MTIATHDTGAIGRLVPAAVSAVRPLQPRREDEVRFDTLLSRTVDAGVCANGTVSGEVESGVENSTDRRQEDGTSRRQFDATCAGDAASNGDEHGDRRRGQDAESRIGDAVTSRNLITIPHSPAQYSSVGTGGDAVVSSAVGVPQRELKKLVRVLRSSSVSGRLGVNLTLDLESLGEVRLDVRLEGKSVFIGASVGDQRAAAALTLSLDELQKRLSDIGLELGAFRIQVGGAPPRAGSGNANETGGGVRVTAMARR